MYTVQSFARFDEIAADADVEVDDITFAVVGGGLCLVWSCCCSCLSFFSTISTIGLCLRILLRFFSSSSLSSPPSSELSFGIQ